MTDQEKKINDIAEASIQRFRNLLPWGTMTETQYENLCIKCAIECQREKVTLLKTIKIPFNNEEQSKSYKFIDSYLTEAQQVLENLENRLK